MTYTPPQDRRGTTNVDLPPDQYRPDQLLRLGRLARELRLTDQILSLDLDTVSLVEGGPAPAWTTLEGDHISFSMKHMPMPYTHLDVAVWLGTNAHELGHVLYSPRRHSPLMERVIEGDKLFMRGVAQLHNIVEDQRQERLILGRYAPWRAYLTAALGHHLVADSTGAWLLMAGRTWLPADVRAEARARFAAERGESAAHEVAQLVGDYQRLLDPGDTEADEAWAVLEALYTLFDLDTPTGGCGGGVMVDGEPSTEEPGEGAPATADEDEPGEPQPGQGEPCQPGTEMPGPEGGQPGDQPGEGEGEGESQGEAPTTGQGAGAGSSGQGTKPFDKGEVKRQLRQGAQRQLDAQDTRDDLAAVLDALDYGRSGQAGAQGEAPVGEYQAATDAARRLHHEVGDALLDLKDQSEPGWVRRTDQGKLNVRRLVYTNAEPDQLYDRYSPGQMDASEMEVVVLLDVSGSMRPHLKAVAEATWALRQAIDDLDGTCTVLTYDTGPHRVLAATGVRPDERMFVPNAMGGTVPDSALAEAYRLLADSQARNRLMLVLTDSGWYNPQRADGLVAAMNQVGITTILAALGVEQPGQSAQLERHNCTHAAHIDQPRGLALLLADVAAAKIAEAL